MHYGHLIKYRYYLDGRPIGYIHYTELGSSDTVLFSNI